MEQRGGLKQSDPALGGTRDDDRVGTAVCPLCV
jgi:hypothetical protein